VVLLSSALLTLDRRRWISPALTFGAVLLAGSALISHARGEDSLIETALAGGSGTASSGLMSVQSATWFVTFSVLLLLARAHERVLVWFVSAVTVGLALATLVLLSGHLFNVIEMIGQSQAIVNSWQTKVCFVLLIASWMARWTIAGQWRPLLGTGISSRALRWLSLSVVAISVIPGIVMSVAFGSGWVDADMALALLIAFVAAGGVLVVLAVFTRIRGLEQELRRLALTDALTGTWNLAAFQALADHLLVDSERTESDVAIIMIDLDGLKTVNDTLGHDAGSRLIADFGQRLTSAVRAGDIAARIGGDEFAVAIRGTLADADRILARLASAVESAKPDLPTGVVMSFSAGAAATHAHAETLEQLLTAADGLMYEAKAGKQGTATAR
jgi:diguanylate cyclase (GGDEF)-like protein